MLTAAFEADYFGGEGESPRFVAISTTPAVLDEARFCAVHGFRADDAVQLASALAARAADSRCRTLAALIDLRRAAATEGLELLPEA